jgi:ubiquitin C
MLIKVRLNSGKTISLDSNEDDAVEILKLKIEKEEGIPRWKQKLQFGGRELQDGHFLEDYNIKNNSVLRLLVEVERDIFSEFHRPGIGMV